MTGLTLVFLFIKKYLDTWLVRTVNQERRGGRGGGEINRKYGQKEMANPGQRLKIGEKGGRCSNYPKEINTYFSPFHVFCLMTLQDSRNPLHDKVYNEAQHLPHAIQ